MSEAVSGPDATGGTPDRKRASVNFWWMAIVGLIVVGYCRYFDGTDFSQDDFVWLCFSKFHPFPIDVFWTDSLCGQFFRPMGQMWWVVVHSVAGDRVLAYQIAFLAVHILNSVLVAKLASRIVSPDAALPKKGGQTPGHSGSISTSSTTGGGQTPFFGQSSSDIAVAAFALFATSPIFVARIATNFLFIFDTLGFFFFLCAIHLEMWGVQKRRVWMSVAALMAALAAYFTKEAYFTLPALLMLVLGTSAEQGWSWYRVWHVRVRLLSHFIVWIVALIWRHEIIGGLGGYGLARPRSLGELGAHLVERGMTLASFTGWSLSPLLARWDRSIVWPFVLSSVVLLVLIIVAWRVKFRPGVWWVLVWIVLTWSPSFAMTTFAPVSFYGPLVGPVILMSGIAIRFRRWRWFIFLITVFNAGWSVLFFADRSVATSELRQQKQMLAETFGDGSVGTRLGDRIMLLRASRNLFPDPFVKYRTPINQRVADILFVNTRNSVAWVICNADGPGEISPMSVSTEYQSGAMPIGSLKAVPLSYQKQMRQIVMRGAPYRFFDWRNGEWVEIDPKELVNR